MVWKHLISSMNLDAIVFVTVFPFLDGASWTKTWSVGNEVYSGGTEVYSGSNNSLKGLSQSRFKPISIIRWHLFLNLQAYFDAPIGDEPLALDMSSMGKGQVWINGQSLGRYWTINAEGSCSTCSYSGTFRPPRCQFGCGHPTQQWYKLRRTISWV